MEGDLNIAEREFRVDIEPAEGDKPFATRPTVCGAWLE